VIPSNDVHELLPVINLISPVVKISVLVYIPLATPLLRTLADGLNPAGRVAIFVS